MESETRGMENMKNQKTIGELLIDKGYVKKEGLEKALKLQEGSEKFIGSILLQSGSISEEQLYEVMSEQFNVPFVKLKQLNIQKSVIDEFPAKYSIHFKLIPVEMNDRSFTVAVSNPMDMHLLDDLKLLLHRDIKAVLASEKDIFEAIKRYYGVGADTIEKITPRADKPGMLPEANIARDPEKPEENASIMKFVNQIFFEAYRERATDIHIEPYEDELKVRYRIDGILYDTKMPPNIKNFQSAVISRIKVMANLDIGERRIPQDGRIKIKIEGQELDLRVSILPTQFGEAVVIRLLTSNIFMGLEKLGMQEEDLKLFEKLIRQPHGIVFVTGPTGSGKTTTLYAVLSKINDSQKKILTIEDPIEYQIKGIVQMQIHPKIQFTFSSGLRSMLRHDPDVMMVGEVRDRETADITIRVALTGHLVFSTLHTNNASGGVTRLIDMGIEPFLAASSVNAFVAQRLVRKICPHCKAPVEVDESVLREFNILSKSGAVIFQGKGCEQCRFTGYKGRTAIYEILLINEAQRRLILKRSSSEEIKKKAVSDGMRTLRQDGWERVLMGITTPSEVLRVTQEEE